MSELGDQIRAEAVTCSRAGQMGRLEDLADRVDALAARLASESRALAEARERLAACERLIVKWRSSADAVRQVTGDYEDGVEYLSAAADLEDALRAALRSTP